MLGRFLKRLGWHRKPVTHAALLWALVAFASLMLLAFGVYGRKLTEIRSGLVEARPAKSRPAENLPSAFGTVIAIEGSSIEIDSKQAYRFILVDEMTDVSRVDGGTASLDALTVGMTVVATGKSDGAETIYADALVILTAEDLDS